MGLRSGAPIVACWAPITVISAINSVQASETRISMPRIRAIGTPPFIIGRRP